MGSVEYNIHDQDYEDSSMTTRKSTSQLDVGELKHIQNQVLNQVEGEGFSAKYISQSTVVPNNILDRLMERLLINITTILKKIIQ